jgi:hypothetical protein
MSIDDKVPSDSPEFYAAKAAYNRAMKAHRTRPLTPAERNALWPAKIENLKKLELIERQMEIIRSKRAR